MHTSVQSRLCYYLCYCVSDKLIQRLQDGPRLTRYKPLQYQQLQVLLEAQRISSQHTEHKVRERFKYNVMSLCFFTAGQTARCRSFNLLKVKSKSSSSSCMFKLQLASKQYI